MDNSLRILPKLTPPPSTTTSLSSSTLSSPISSTAEEFFTTKEAVESRLDNYPQADGDEAAAFLKVVIEYLPRTGAIVLMRDILSLTDAELPQLRIHLIECILLPSKYGIREREGYGY
jgi:hypothetical protein